MKKSRLLGAVCACVLTILPTTTPAALIDQGNGTVLDTDLQIYWLADANPAGTSSWEGAQDWIATLNSNNHLGYSDWRLPSTLIPDPSCTEANSHGYSCAGSELGHLFYAELGGSLFNSIFTSSDPDLALFSNLQSNPYWSGTVNPLDPNKAFYFSFNNGFQGTDPKTGTLPLYLWAVRDATVVPIPPALWLFGSGLLGLAGMARKKAA